MRNKSYGRFSASLFATPKDSADLFAETVSHVVSGLVDHDVYLSMAEHPAAVKASQNLQARVARLIEFDANPVGELILTSSTGHLERRWNGFNQVAPLGVQRLLSTGPTTRLARPDRSEEAGVELRSLVASTFVEQVRCFLSKPARAESSYPLLAAYRRLGNKNAAIEDCINQIYSVPATTLTDCTTELACSRRTIQRELARSKLTFQTLRRAVQINVASHLLRESTSSLTDVSHLAGFYDSAHFCHAWKQSCGINPSQYRALAT